jgi:hypothetical protein
MNAWWNNLESVQAINTWMEVIVLAGATLSFICLLLLWRNGNHMVRHLIDREQRSNKRIKAVEKAAEQIRKELLSTQQNQDIADQQRRLAEMDADALRKEVQAVRSRYHEAEGALKDRIKELKDIHITQGVTAQEGVTTQNFGADNTVLDPQQKKMLAKLLKTGSKGELDIISVLDDPNSHQAATELKTIFDTHGWTTSEIVQSAFSHPQEGIILMIHSKQTAPSYAKFLQKTLTTIGLRVFAQINSKYREWSLSMIVGKIDAA